MVCVVWKVEWKVTIFVFFASRCSTSWLINENFVDLQAVILLIEDKLRSVLSCVNLQKKYIFRHTETS
jgi:hypothetical protein